MFCLRLALVGHDGFGFVNDQVSLLNLVVIKNRRACVVPKSVRYDLLILLLIIQINERRQHFLILPLRPCISILPIFFLWLLWCVLLVLLNELVRQGLKQLSLLQRLGLVFFVQIGETSLLLLLQHL